MKALSHLALALGLVLLLVFAAWGLPGLEVAAGVALSFYVAGCVVAAFILHDEDKHSAEPISHTSALLTVLGSWLTVLLASARD